MTMSNAMNDENEILSEADEIAALLPWYVSGKISASDKARVDAYAVSHPDVLDHIVLAREEADTVFAANQDIHPSRAALDRSLAKLHANIAAEPRARLYAVKTSLLDQIGDWLGGFTPRQLAYAGVVAALAIAVQAASIGALVTSGSGSNGYITASGPGAALQKGTFALVAFQPAAPAGTVSAFLAANGYTIVEGPRAGGIFRLRLSGNVLSDAAAQDVLTTVKARTDLVSFATLAPAAP